MLRRTILVALSLLLLMSGACAQQATTPLAEGTADSADTVVVGAERFDAYLPLLQGKRVALLSNHSGLLPDGRHTLDAMLEHGINVTTIFSPEHGFRGNADAGEHVKSSVDPVTGIPIASLYDGRKRTPSAATMSNIDVIVTDLQDVGLRYYTYYITMLDLMKAAATHGKEFVVLDRPNPNGMTVDGPILDMKYASGVGRLPIPVVHGMTLGELAQMIVGEGWLDSTDTLRLHVVCCEGYTHATRYELPVAPSPNLQSMKAIYLYPSTCYFEATPVSLGRGTDKAFCIYGHPDFKGRNFSFTPESRPGAVQPPLLGKKCYGTDLSYLDDEEIIAGGINLDYLIDAYYSLEMGDEFFTTFFERLIGVDYVRKMIEWGNTADEIKARWQPDVERFREQRRPYLLYPEE